MSVARYRTLMTEEGMRGTIAEAVEFHGGHLFYVPRTDAVPSMTDWPDLELILPHKRTVAHVELKSQRRPITPGQARVLAMLRECDRSEAFLVRPVPRDETETSYDAFLAWLNGGEL